VEGLLMSFRVGLAGALAIYLSLILGVFTLLTNRLWPKYLKEGKFQITDQAMFFSTFWGLSIAVLLVILIFFLPEVDKAIAVLDALSGAVFGWFLGIYLSPHTTAEEEAFSGYKSALAGLLSGVVLTKAQTLLSERYPNASGIHLKDLEYLLIFWVATGVCTATIYNARAYGGKPEPDTKKDQKVAPQNDG
jgi:hypothetical protein